MAYAKISDTAWGYLLDNSRKVKENIAIGNTEFSDTSPLIMLDDEHPEKYTYGTYKIDIIRGDIPNANVRIYPIRLLEMIKAGQVSIDASQLGFADHDEFHASPRKDKQGNYFEIGYSVTRTFCVWQSVDVERKSNGEVWLTGIFTLVGELGKLARAILNAGGGLGVSMLGYADSEKVTYNGTTCERLIPETYSLISFGDWVHRPSSRMYFFNRGDKGTTQTVKETEQGLKKTAQNGIIQVKNNFHDLLLGDLDGSDTA